MQFKKSGVENIKDESRVCIDFRKLNKLFILKCQPFPLNRVLSLLKPETVRDLRLWIQICVGDQPRTRFVTKASTTNGALFTLWTKKRCLSFADNIIM